MKIPALFLGLLLATTVFADRLPAGAIIVAKATRHCGAETTFFVVAKSIDKKKRQTLKWILDYTLTEKRIGHLDFAQDTGTFLKFDKLDAYLKRQPLVYTAKLNQDLLDMRSIKKDLRDLRAAAVKHKQTNDKIDPVVNKYWDTEVKITEELQTHFGVQSAETGLKCK